MRMAIPLADSKSGELVVELYFDLYYLPGEVEVHQPNLLEKRFGELDLSCIERSVCCCSVSGAGAVLVSLPLLRPMSGVLWDSDWITKSDHASFSSHQNGWKFPGLSRADVGERNGCAKDGSVSFSLGPLCYSQPGECSTSELYQVEYAEPKLE